MKASSQPSLSQSEITLDRGERDAERDRNLLAIHSTEIAQFDRLGLALIHLGELVQGFAHFQNVRGSTRGQHHGFFQRNGLGRSSTFGRTSRTNVIYKNDPHQPGCNTEEMR